MAILQILKYPDPLLKKQSKKIVKVNDEIRELLEDMAETMYSAGGVGLAAPQVGILKRAIVVDIGEDIHKIINPVITNYKGDATADEGCLCFPGMMGTVKRYFWIRVKGIDENGKEINIEAEDLLSRVIQHEIDHLNGILIIDRAEPGTFREVPKEEIQEEAVVNE